MNPIICTQSITFIISRIAGVSKYRIGPNGDNVHSMVPKSTFPKSTIPKITGRIPSICDRGFRHLVVMSGVQRLRDIQILSINIFFSYVGHGCD